MFVMQSNFSLFDCIFFDLHSHAWRYHSINLKCFRIFSKAGFLTKYIEYFQHESLFPYNHVCVIYQWYTNSNCWHIFKKKARNRSMRFAHANLRLAHANMRLAHANLAERTSNKLILLTKNYNAFLSCKFLSEATCFPFNLQNSYNNNSGRGWSLIIVVWVTLKNLKLAVKNGSIWRDVEKEEEEA